MTQNSIADFIRLGRPKFLFYSAIMQTLGVAAVVLMADFFSFEHYLIGVALGWLLHLSTHYVNEYFDYEADVANEDFTSWTGGSRVLVEGAIPRPIALLAGISSSLLYALAFLALYLTKPALLGPSPPLLVATGYAALVVAWMYSAPPVRLVRLGLGEVTVATVLCIMLPAGASILQVGYVVPVIWWIAIPLFQIQVARMMIMNVPDAKSDQASGKNTLVVRLGAARTAKVHNALQCSAYASLLILSLFGKIPVIPAILIALTFPVAVRQMQRMNQGGVEIPDRFQTLASTALRHVILSAIAAIAGIFIEAFLTG